MGRGILCPFALYKSYKAFILTGLRGIFFRQSRLFFRILADRSKINGAFLTIQSAVCEFHEISSSPKYLSWGTIRHLSIAFQ